MKFFSVILFIPLVLGSTDPSPRDSPKFSMAHAELPFPICGNCSKIRDFQGNTGFACHYEDDQKVVQKFGTPTNNFPDCLPETYMLTGDINYLCCFWSPELGCTALIGRQLHDTNHDYCDTCKHNCTGVKNADSAGNNKIPGYGYLISLVCLAFRIC
ncbi:uncharacterized protein LOC108043487 [Drosophila rhopaloa]|uniref:Uncharacterized protein LOC108043487 n=1 Tax=Drosophila rhopaloa TaxID=1041015 RepID=A0A6P4EM74_DRORH|nr:uncharacterized protein LOC108043487 [Drosophila rhopaloa]